MRTALWARVTGRGKGRTVRCRLFKVWKRKKKKISGGGGVILDFAQPTFLPPTPPGLDKTLHMTDFMAGAEGLVPPTGEKGSRRALSQAQLPLSPSPLCPWKKGIPPSQVPQHLLPRGKRQNKNSLHSLLLSSIGQRARSCIAA